VRALAKLKSRSPAVLGGLADAGAGRAWLDLVPPARASADHRQASAQGSADHDQPADALEKIAAHGKLSVTMSPVEFTAFMSKEADRWGEGAQRVRPAIGPNARAALELGHDPAERIMLLSNCQMPLQRISN